MSVWTTGHRSTLAALLFAAFGAPLAGCVTQPVVAVDALPVRRVVVYRNGVAYFERSGHVDEEQVRFKMRPSEVGDFLATLAVMERGGSSVRAAAFPLNPPDKPDPASDDDDTAKPAPAKPGKETDKNALQTVVLSLDGREHDLQVGYVAESPVWRPSYRLVVRDGGQADLQAWGIVQNVSGEDWKNVSLSLIAGAPLAFDAQLAAMVIPPRPTVTDEGEVISAVPHGETSLNQEPAPPQAPPAADEGYKVEGLGDLEGPSTDGALSLATRSRGRMAPKKAGAGAAADEAPAPAAAMPMARLVQPQAISTPRDLRSLAAVAMEGGTTRYDLPVPVTIPDKSATMVMLLSRQVSGEALFLFAPDPGVEDSASHPFRVARFVNGAGGTLERGPIAVFEQGAFLGQGMVDPLPAGATATVPFALERAIAIDSDPKFDERGERVFKIENSVLTIERDRVTQTTYRVRNGGDTEAKLLVKHPRISGARLFSPPKGTEDNVGTESALVPTTVLAHATGELLVDERTTEPETVDWYSDVADSAVKAMIASAGTGADAEASHRLSLAWSVRNDIVQKRQEREKLEQQTIKLSQATEETRRNLRAIEKNRTAEALRQKLTARLAETAAKLDDVNRRSVDLDSQLAELSVRFSEAIRDIAYVAPALPSAS